MVILPANSRPVFLPSEARDEPAMSARATAWAGWILQFGRQVARVLGALILLGSASAHNLNQRADYIGFEIGDEFVVGYGLDYKGRYRNLPFVGVLKA